MNDEEFRKRFRENQESRETLELDRDPEEEILNELLETDIEYEKVVVQTVSGSSYLYIPEEDFYTELDQQDSANAQQPKELVMEYNTSWTPVDMTEPISGAEAYMFRL